MKETRTRFIPPPTPRAELEDVVLYIKRLNVLLPGFMDQLQRMVAEMRAELYDIGVPVPDDQNLIEAEAQYAETDSAGVV